MNIALIAHDRKKDDLIQFATAYKPILSKHTLYATGTTGQRVIDETGLAVHRFQSGPLGGDQQIGAMIAQNNMDMIIFFPGSVDGTAARTGCYCVDPFM